MRIRVSRGREGGDLVSDPFRQPGPRLQTFSGAFQTVPLVSYEVLRLTQRARRGRPSKLAGRGRRARCHGAARPYRFSRSAAQPLLAVICVSVRVCPVACAVPVMCAALAGLWPDLTTPTLSLGACPDEWISACVSASRGPPGALQERHAVAPCAVVSGRVTGAPEGLGGPSLGGLRSAGAGGCRTTWPAQCPRNVFVAFAR